MEGEECNDALARQRFSGGAISQLNGFVAAQLAARSVKAVIPAVAVRRISRTSLQRVRDVSTHRNPEKPMDRKISKLRDILIRHKRVLIAFSGGVDSSFLLAFAVKTLGRNNVLAVTAVSETYPKQELVNARAMAAKLGARHKILRTCELNNIKFSSNPPERCFYCKDELFSKLSSLAAENKMVLCDATNYSDNSDYRPGRKAARKWAVASPILEAKITKSKLRSFSRRLKLGNWNSPAQACLASRIPYGTKINREELSRIERGEEYLKKMGFNVVRIRSHGDLARLEVAADSVRKLAQEKIRKKISVVLKKLGWKYATIDMDGYKMGSLNRQIGH